MRRTRRLGRYHLTERIAYGGMAEIFRGFTYTDEGFRRDVAIKKLLPHYLEDKQFIQMLTDEFKLVSYLRHSNIAEVYELAEVEGDLLVVMEYVDGKDLRSTLEKARKRGITPQLDDIVYLMARALDGLYHAHLARDDRGEPLNIVHRDFSPANVLITYDGQVKICDFGIAKARHNRVTTKTGIIKGKIKYMSPEQAFGRTLDARSDVFSAGSVLYELCTGRPPFQAPNEIDLIFAVRDAAPTPVRQVNPNVPEALEAIVDKAMHPSLQARYQTAKQMRDALLRYLRATNPSYRRTRLARFMKKLWAQEIDAELRALEDFVLDLPADEREEDYGRNLIADALGPDAAYNRFSPNPTRVTRESAHQGRERSDIVDARTTTPETPLSGHGTTDAGQHPLEGEKTVKTGPKGGG